MKLDGSEPIEVRLVPLNPPVAATTATKPTAQLSAAPGKMLALGPNRFKRMTAKSSALLRRPSARCSREARTNRFVPGTQNMERSDSRH